MIDPAQSVSAFKGAVPDKLERVPMKVLGQDEFLKLLVVQMRNQDPLKPVSDTEFIAQMAEFSNLEQTKAMNVEIKELRQSNAFTQAASLMGKQVRLLSGDDTFTKGIVTEIEVMEGEVSVIVNGKAYELGQVVKVSSGETEDKNTKE